MKKMINFKTVEGVLYDHKLKAYVSSKNIPYIKGTIAVAVSDDKTIINSVQYVYEAPTFSKGGANSKYEVLKKIIDNEYKTFINGGDEAVKVSIKSAILRNEFFLAKDNVFVSTQANMGGFIDIIPALNERENERNKFKVDMIINGVKLEDADLEKKLPVRATLSGYIFDFRNEIYPAIFTVTNPNAITYFTVSQQISQAHPLFTQIWGIENSTIVTKTVTTENAFGEAEVNTTESKSRQYLVTGALKVPYVWDDANSLTAAEVMEAIQQRDVKLAKQKSEAIEREANKTSNPASTTAAAPIQNGTYGF